MFTMFTKFTKFTKFTMFKQIVYYVLPGLLCLLYVHCVYQIHYVWTQ